MTTPASVPMLDVNRQNAPLLDEITAAIEGVCRSGAFVKGPAVTQLEKDVAAYCQADHGVACASGTDALLVALMALGVGPGDEVILPSFTFFATAGSVWRVGARPVFADILPETYNIDPAHVARLVTPRTKAVMPVHLFGQTADMEAINQIARRHGLAVVEDAAQSIGSEHRGRRCGSLGTVGCFSFYPTKNLGALGDAGMVTTNDAALADRMRVLCDHGQSPRYHHHLVGLNSRLDTLQAAALGVKLRRLDAYAQGRQRHAEAYLREFKRSLPAGSIQTPSVAPGVTTVWNQFTVRVPGGRRDALQKFLAERQIGSAVYYPIPLHLQACFAGLGYRRGDLPHSERAAEEVLSLPIYGEMTDAERARVIESVVEFASAQGGATRRAA